MNPSPGLELVHSFVVVAEELSITHVNGSVLAKCRHTRSVR